MSWNLESAVRVDMRRIVALRIGGYTATANPRHRMLFHLFCVVILVVSGLYAAAQPQPIDWITRFWIWCVWYVAIAEIIPWGFYHAVNVYVVNGSDINEALTSSAQTVYEAWSKRWLNPSLQITVAGLIGVLGPITLASARKVPASESPIQVAWPSYVILAFTGYLVGAAALWMVSGTVLIVSLERADCIRLIPEAPAYTPGLEALARAAGMTFVAGSGYLLALLAPFLFWLGRVGTLSTNLQLTFIKLIVIVLSGSVLIVSGIVPQLSLSRSVRRARAERLHQLETQLDSLRAAGADAYFSRSGAFQGLAATPSSTLGTGNMFSIGLGILALIAPTFILFVR